MPDRVSAPALGRQADGCSGPRPAGRCRHAESRGLDRPVGLAAPSPLALLALPLPFAFRCPDLALLALLSCGSCPGSWPPCWPGCSPFSASSPAGLSVRLLLAIALASPAGPEARAGPAAPRSLVTLPFLALTIRGIRLGPVGLGDLAVDLVGEVFELSLGATQGGGLVAQDAPAARSTPSRSCSIPWPACREASAASSGIPARPVARPASSASGIVCSSALRTASNRFWASSGSVSSASPTVRRIRSTRSSSCSRCSSSPCLTCWRPRRRGGPAGGDPSWLRAAR